MCTETTKRNWVEEIGKPALDAIREMVLALDIESAAENYTSELQRERCVELLESACIQCKDDETTEELREAVAVNIADGTIEPDDFEWDEDDARQAIEDDPLSIELGGWWMIGSEPEPDEYRILLSTGGPAVRIVGELGQCNEPSNARLEVQDWWKPWTEYREENSAEILMRYVSCFSLDY